jgi:hypothetical protein
MAATKKSPVLNILIGFIAILIALAIVIPNALRSKMLDEGTAHASTLRVINASEITYATNYPKMGYAPNLFILGPGLTDSVQCDPSRACLLDTVVACPSGIGHGWCIKSGYRFNLQSSSQGPPYKDYWVTATPIEAKPKLRNYCSAEDARIRIAMTPPLTRPYTREECLAMPFDPNSYQP